MRFMEGRTRFSTSWWHAKLSSTLSQPLLLAKWVSPTSKHCTETLPYVEGVMCKTTNSRRKTHVELERNPICSTTHFRLPLQPTTTTNRFITVAEISNWRRRVTPATCTQHQFGKLFVPKFPCYTESAEVYLSRRSDLCPQSHPYTGIFALQFCSPIMFRRLLVTTASFVRVQSSHSKGQWMWNFWLISVCFVLKLQSPTCNF